MKELGDLDRYDYDAAWYRLDMHDISEVLNERAKRGWTLHTIQDCGDRVFCVFYRTVFDECKLERDRATRRLRANSIREIE